MIKIRRISNINSKRKQLSNELIKIISKGSTLSSITVKELTSSLNMSRSNFYNYFVDIYDLLEWTYDTEIFSPFGELSNLKMHREGFRMLYSKVLKDKEFYLNVFKNDSNYSLDKYYERYLYEVFEEYAEEINKLWSVELAGRYYAKSMAYILVLWLESGCSIDMEEILEFSIYARHTTLHDMIKQTKVLDRHYK